ncbi:MAG TPA: protein-tyrosine kinase [Candidatus Eisenbergiella merdavium]|uniref:Protein-tyrosine kinase n=1 Tax=Candidatus Eisenbergiella merdavium TaxID=2838551 RepID=A0A9D2NIP8_9FIRM|nr:protein-tyrosine kinase [Candidatus Eisenbergiella merdavium]
MEKQRQMTDEIEIDLAEVFRRMLARLPMMLAAGLLTALIAFFVSRFVMTPAYESTTKIYVLSRQENSSVTYSDLQMGTQLTQDYAELIQGRYVLEQVAEILSLDMSYEALRGMVSVSVPDDTRIISISVSDSDPVRAMEIANCIRETATVYITDVMDIEAVNVVETAFLPTRKSGPNVKLITLLGGLLGIFAIAAVAVTEYLMDDTIKTAEDVERYLELSTLAMIPLSENEKQGRRKKKK